jgi:hypothetical protein
MRLEHMTFSFWYLTLVLYFTALTSRAISLVDDEKAGFTGPLKDIAFPM